MHRESNVKTVADSGIPPRGKHPSGRGWVGSSLRGGVVPTLDNAIHDGYGLAGEYKYLDGVDPCDTSAFAPLTPAAPELEVVQIWALGTNPLTEYRVWLATPS